MPTPMLETPAKTSNSTCQAVNVAGEVCGATLVLTGKPITFGETAYLTAPLNNRFARRVNYKGWVPSLLVTICPVCDGGKDMPATDVTEVPVESEPTVDAEREAYLNMLDPGRHNIGGEL